MKENESRSLCRRGPETNCESANSVLAISSEWMAE